MRRWQDIPHFCDTSCAPCILILLSLRHDAWVPIEVLVMQPHCIGVIWRELNTFSLFSRMPL